MRTSPPILLVASLAALVAPPALAQDPCAEDVKRFCAEVTPGSRRLLDCLRENEDRLSAACREKRAAEVVMTKRLVVGFVRACRDDTAFFCPGVEPGEGRVVACLAQHHLSLATSCQAELNRLSEARQRVAAVRSACAADLATHCRGVPPQTGPLLECLRAHQESLSSACNAGEVRAAVEAARIVEILEETTREERAEEVIAILQGIDSVAFSRNQILLQFDSYQGLAGTGNANRVLLNPQLVFGERGEFGVQAKLPVAVFYPYAAAAPTRSEVGDVVTAFAWNFHSHSGPRIAFRQYLSVALTWPAGDEPPFGAGWGITPAYAVAAGLARWLSLTTQVAWSRSLGSGGTYPELNLLMLEPILVANLPGRSFLVLDTKLGWDLVNGDFLPLMKGAAGLFTDQRRTVSISAWFQGPLNGTAESRLYQYEVGLGLAYFFDW